MNRSDRRSALRLALGAALVPAIWSRFAQASVPNRLIAPPTTMMHYTRRVTRDIADGTHFSVWRSFAVTFRQFADGFMLHGQQEAVEVEAPARLERFADMERARVERALFPLALDPFGQILSTEVAVPANAQLHAAIEEALATLAGYPMAQDEREQLSSYIAAIESASQRITAHLPIDLFAPIVPVRHEERRLTLPGGTEGLVETLFEAARDAETGLMRTASREIITHVGANSRRSREEWSLTGD